MVSSDCSEFEYLLGVFGRQQYSGHNSPACILSLASQDLTLWMCSLIFSHWLKENAEHISGALVSLAAL